MLIKKLALEIKREMNEWKGSLSYNEIETFVGWTLARLLTAQLITQDEEKWLRSYLVN